MTISSNAPQDDSTLSAPSRGFAAFEEYLQDNLPRRVCETLEAMLNEQFLPLEESLKTALPEAIRTYQAQMFRDWERHSSGGVRGQDGDVLKQSHETEDVISHGTDDVTGQESQAEPLLPQSALQDVSLSAFYVEPAPTLFGSILENIVQGECQESGVGPSRTVTDSGYASLRPNSDVAHLESLVPLAATGEANACTYPDPRIADFDFPFGFDFDLSDLPAKLGNV